MSLLRMMLLEMKRNRATTALLVAAVALGAMLFPLSNGLLRIHDARAARMLEQKDAAVKERMQQMWDEYRKITLGLGFNILILPEGQSLADFYVEGRITRDMPEEYSHRLARSDVVSIQHVLPSLHHRMTWQPFGVSINLIGVRGELPAMGGKDPKKPLREAVPKGKVVLGSELCRIAGTGPGKTVSILGKAFVVDSCHGSRGDQDDVSAWIDLSTLQAMLGKQGKVNAILALECRCEADSTLPNIAKIREELERVLPGTRVVEFMTQALTRAEARHEAVLTARQALTAEQEHRARLTQLYRRMASVLVPLCAVACMLAVSLVTWVNGRNRRREIAVLRAVGWSAARVLRLFVVKALLVGVGGAVLGTAAAAGIIWRIGVQAAVPIGGDGMLWVMSACAAALMTVVASWLPALAAATSDPAPVLQKE